MESGRLPIGLRGASLIVLAMLVLSVIFDWPPLAKPQWKHPVPRQPVATSERPADVALEPAPAIQADGDSSATVAAAEPAVPRVDWQTQDEAASTPTPTSVPAPPAAAMPAPAQAPAPPVVPKPRAEASPAEANISSALPAPHRQAEPAPTVAIIIDDLGVNVTATQEALRLPAPLTFAFLPYGHRLHAFGRAAHAAGNEVFLHLPMQALGNVDAGPSALVEGLSPGEIGRRIAWALAQVPDADGVNNHMGSRLTADPDAMMQVMADLAGRGMVFVDSLTTPRSVAASTALSAGIPAATRDVFLDDDQSSPAIERQLDELERIAREKGTAVAIGHPHPTTLAVLARWIPEARARGVHFVTASRLIAIRTCGASSAVPSAACMVPVAGPSPGRARPT